MKLKLKDERKKADTAIRNLFDDLSDHKEEQLKLKEAFEKK